MSALRLLYLALALAGALHPLSLLLAHGLLVVAVDRQVLPTPALWALASLPLSLAAAVLLLRRAHRPMQLRPALVLGIAAAVVHGLGLAAGLLRA